MKSCYEVSKKAVQIIHHRVGGLGAVYPGASYPFNIDNVNPIV